MAIWPRLPDSGRMKCGALTCGHDTRDLVVHRFGAPGGRYGTGGAMTQVSQRERAEAFRRRHREGGILVLPNAWDVLTARGIERAGFDAIATSSAGVAWALGYADGERSSRGATLPGARRSASADRVPAT